MIGVSSLFILGAILQAITNAITDNVLLLKGPGYIVAKNVIVNLSDVICAASMLFIFDVGSNEGSSESRNRQPLQLQEPSTSPDASTVALHITSSYYPIKSSFVRRSMLTSTFAER